MRMSRPVHKKKTLDKTHSSSPSLQAASLPSIMSWKRKQSFRKRVIQALADIQNPFFVRVNHSGVITSVANEQYMDVLSTYDELVAVNGGQTRPFALRNIFGFPQTIPPPVNSGIYSAKKLIEKISYSFHATNNSLSKAYLTFYYCKFRPGIVYPFGGLADLSKDTLDAIEVETFLSNLVRTGELMTSSTGSGIPQGINQVSWGTTGLAHDHVGVTPFDFAPFVQCVKVFGVKHQILEPGAILNKKFKSSRRNTEISVDDIFTPSVVITTPLGSYNAWDKHTWFIIVRAHGQVCSSNEEGVSGLPGYAPISIPFVHRMKLSWRDVPGDATEGFQVNAADPLWPAVGDLALIAQQNPVEASGPGPTGQNPTVA